MFSLFSKKDKPSPEPSEQYINLRNSLLMSDARQLNIQSSGKHPDVWGVLIDENFDKYTQSVWVTADGRIQIFQFVGESPIREDPRMADLLRHLFLNAELCYSALTPTTTCPLPSRGNIRFSVFTFTGMYTSEIEVRELNTAPEKHALTELNNSYHNILFLNNWGKLQFQIMSEFFKPCATVAATKVYSQPDLNSAPIIELARGEVLELGVIKDVAGTKWFTVTLPSGQWGYLPGETNFHPILHVKLLEKEATVYSEPSVNSTVVTHMKKDEIFDVIPFGSDDQNWTKIRDTYGIEGYIDRKTQCGKV